jgi:hypothetical protein
MCPPPDHPTCIVVSVCDEKSALLILTSALALIAAPPTVKAISALQMPFSSALTHAARRIEREANSLGLDNHAFVFVHNLHVHEGVEFAALQEARNEAIAKNRAKVCLVHRGEALEDKCILDVDTLVNYFNTNKEIKIALLELIRVDERALARTANGAVLDGKGT